MGKSKFIISLENVFSDLKNDNLINYSFQYYTMGILYTLFFISSYLGNPFYIAWFLFGILPLLDFYVKPDLQNPTREQQRIMKKEFRFKIPILVSLLVDWIVYIWGVNEVANSSKGFLYKAGIVFVLSIFQASSINISHEINHKLNRWERILGTLNLSKNFYMHFLIEHNEGHHRNVATPLDPATSKYGQTLYNFIPQSVKGSFLSAWKIESRKCRELYGTEYTFKNRMYYFTAAIFLFPFSLWYLFNYKVMIAASLIGFCGSLYLESINYIEHYGLERNKNEDGTYEKVDTRHSWNAPHRISNYILLKIQRHSDHHENPLKPYQNLCSFEESPTLPNGYAACFLLSFYPNLWFEIMNPLLTVYKKGEKPSKELLSKVEGPLLKFILGLNLFFSTLLIYQHSLII